MEAALHPTACGRHLFEGKGWHGFAVPLREIKPETTRPSETPLIFPGSCPLEYSTTDTTHTPRMAPLDIATGEGPACSANMVSPRCRPIRSPSDEDPAVSSPQPASVQKAENSNNNHNLQDAGERRRTRALKLRQTRTRNAARAQIYCTSAEDSEDEVRGVEMRGRDKRSLFFIPVMQSLVQAC